jgi:hypothetical protein
VTGVGLAIAALGFAVASRWPREWEAVGLAEGLALVGLGVLVVSIPGILAVAVFSEVRTTWLRWLFGIPLALIAVFFGFVWGAIIEGTRADWGWH